MVVNSDSDYHYDIKPKILIAISHIYMRYGYYSTVQYEIRAL